MSEAVSSANGFGFPGANKTLDISVKSWFVIALAGQWLFAFYIMVTYPLTAINSLNVIDFSPAPSLRSNEGLILLTFFIHVIPVIYMSLLGIFQLVPSIRNRYKRFHRWNGRAFLLLGFSGALTGLFLQWSKGFDTNTAASLGISLNGLLILVASFYAWRYAVNRRFDQHRRWAVHAFFLVNGVWTFRLYLMGWYMVNQGPNGNTSSIDGPMDIFLSFACYMLPMLFAEIYFWASKQRSKRRVWGGAILTSIGAVVTLVGVVAAAMMMWAPRISQVFSAISAL